MIDQASRRRVVITGMGCVTPMGTEIPRSGKACKKGTPASTYTTIFDASRFPTKISAEVRDWDVSDVGQDPEDWKMRGRHTRFAVGAAQEGRRRFRHARQAVDPTRLGVYLGSGEGQQDFDCFTRMMTAALQGEEFDLAKFTKAGLEMLHPLFELEQEPNMPAGHLAAMFNAQGPNANCLTACAASSQAIGEAVKSFAAAMPT